MEESGTRYEGDGHLAERQVSVLIIDDQRLIGKMIGAALDEQKDILFVHCLDPEEAFQFFDECDPTVILLDLVMPKIDGLTLLDSFRHDDRTRKVPIIVLSGKEEGVTKAECFRRGASDYLVKLPDAVELVARIRHHSAGYVSQMQRDAAMAALAESRRQLELRGRFIQETFGRYLSDDVVNSLLESPEGQELGGKEKNVTIMMSDLRGFTSMSERLPAEQVVRLINNFLGVMTDIILRRKGTIIEFLGDAIFAVFGAPISRPSQAADAVACAVEMQQSMTQVNEINRDQGLPAVEMGIGLNTGRVAVGNIGSEKRAKYGVVGRHVNLAARIESYTVAAQILISDSTAEEVGPILLRRGQMTVKPKGVKEPIVIHDVVGIGGEYSLFMPEEQKEELYEPPQPIGIRFNVVSGKDAGAQFHEATIKAFTLREARIESKVPLEKHINVKFRLAGHDGQDMEGDLYAKVMGWWEDGFHVRFTSIPPETEAFLQGMLYWHKA